ncbi:MAG: hypothetical protein A3K10_06615 [Bacteroidetes bacterium RIFCSPLOWO2_12_FULL_31_6]|nr:MAG: hypothetical protein A3K10_06615 [Bacteroidetes bacterium RIFCSPLOWO2_12_FULL_31_6]
MFVKLKYILLSIFSTLICYFTSAETIVSPFNGKSINTDSLATSSYSFVCWGHWYGSPLNWHSALPSATVLSNIDSINAIQPTFIMAMGDLYRHTDSSTFYHFKSLVLKKFTSPIFNAVGNHEMDDRSFYESQFGKTIYSFRINGEIYIVLDGEIANCDLEGEQLSFFINKLDSALNDNSIKNVFIISHKLIWSTLDGVTEIFKNIHSNYECYNYSTFIESIYPKLLNLSDKKPVYWISGDYGFSLFYHKIKDHDLTFLACSITDSDEDAYLKFSISNDDKVYIQANSFTGKKLLPLESYNIDYWKLHLTNMNIISKAQLMVYNKYFWCGITISLLLILSGITLMRLRNK